MYVKVVVVPDVDGVELQLGGTPHGGVQAMEQVAAPKSEGFTFNTTEAPVRWLNMSASTHSLNQACRE